MDFGGGTGPTVCCYGTKTEGWKSRGRTSRDPGTAPGADADAEGEVAAVTEVERDEKSGRADMEKSKKEKKEYLPFTKQVK